MRGRLRLLSVAILVFFLFMLYAAAVSGDEVISLNEGKRLYQKNCAGCHGDYENSAKGGRSMNRILSAVRTLHPHKQFYSLTDGDLLLIAIALKDVKD